MSNKENNNIEIMSEHVIEGNNVRVIKSKTDPLALRISAGGRDDVGYYINFRGDVDGVEKTLNVITKAFKEFKKRHKKLKQ